MSKLRSPAGDLRAQRDAAASGFFHNKIKGSGPCGAAVFTPMSKPRLAQTDAQVGSLPAGGNTVGGVVGGLSDKDSYQGKKAGKS